MSKLIAIPLLIAGALGLYFSIPGLLRPNPVEPMFSYWLAAPAVACADAGLGIAFGLITLPRKMMRAIAMAGTDEFTLLPRQSRRERVRNAGFLLVACALPAVALAFHLKFTFDPVPGSGYVFVAGAGILLLLQALVMIRRAWSMRKHSDWRVMLTTNHVRLDVPFGMRIEMDAIEPLQVADFRARVFCFEHVLLHMGRYVQVAVRLHHEIVFELAGKTTIPRGETLCGSAEPMLDSIQYRPSGMRGMTMYPFYHWEIRVELMGDVNYAAIFPLTVERTAGSETGS